METDNVVYVTAGLFKVVELLDSFAEEGVVEHVSVMGLFAEMAGGVAAVSTRGVPPAKVSKYYECHLHSSTMVVKFEIHWEL